MRLIDSHAHLDGPEFDADRTQVVVRARRAGLEKVVLIGIWREAGSFGNALEMTRADPDFFAATIGIHPHDCAAVLVEDWERLAALATDPLVVGIGETGLDYHYDHSPRDRQRAAFERQLELAASVNKPVTVHLREADEDSVALLRTAGAGRTFGGVIHCFSGDAKMAERYLDLGLFLSLSGIVTFKKAEALQDAARQIPLDRLLLETDCPFLTPMPHRGQRNEPAHVALVAAKVAEIKGLTVEAVAAAAADNARSLFRLA